MYSNSVLPPSSQLCWSGPYFISLHFLLPLPIHPLYYPVSFFFLWPCVVWMDNRKNKSVWVKLELKVAAVCMWWIGDLVAIVNCWSRREWNGSRTISRFKKAAEGEMEFQLILSLAFILVFSRFFHLDFSLSVSLLLVLSNMLISTGCDLCYFFS